MLSGPDGVAIAVASVTPVSGSSILYDLNFATQTRPGYYKLQVGPDVTAPDGGRLTVFNSSLYLKGDPSGAAVSGAPRTFIASTPSMATGVYDTNCWPSQASDLLAVWMKQPSALLG